MDILSMEIAVPRCFKRKVQFLANLKRAGGLAGNFACCIRNRPGSAGRLQNFLLTLKALPWLLAAIRPLHTNELRFAMSLDARADYSTICTFFSSAIVLSSSPASCEVCVVYLCLKS